MAKVTAKKRQRKNLKTKLESPFVNYWDKSNFILLFVGLAVLILGFYFMSVGSWDSTVSLSVSPIVLLVAYLVVFPLSILYKKKNKTENSADASSES